MQFYLYILFCSVILLISVKSQASTEDTITYMLIKASDHYDKGEYLQAKEIIKKTHNLRLQEYPYYSSEIVKSNINVARTHLYLWEYDSAIIKLQEAERIYKQCENCSTTERSDIYYFFGQIYKSKGDNSTAIRYLKQAVFVIDTSDDKFHNIFSVAYDGLGYCEMGLGNLDNSIEYFNLAQESIKCLNSTRFDVYHYTGLAFVYAMKKDFQKAIELQEICFNKTLQDSVNNLYQLILLGNNLGYDNITIGNIERAEFYLSFTSKILLNNNRIPDEYVYLMDSYSKLYHAKGELLNSLISSQKALKILAPLSEDIDSLSNPDIKFITNQIIALDVLKNKVKTLLALYNKTQKEPYLQSAIETSVLSINILHELRASYLSMESRLEAQKHEHGIYASTLAILWQAYSINKDTQYAYRAFWVSEKSKAAELLNSIKETDAEIKGNVPGELTLELDRLKKTIALYQSTIYKEQESLEPDSTVISNLEYNLLESQKAYAERIEELEKKYPKYHQLKYDPSVASIASVQRTLPRGASLLQYNISDTCLYTFCITKNKVHFNKQEIAEDFFHSLNDYQKCFREFDFSRQSYSELSNFAWLSKSLYDVLIQPIEDYIEGDRLVIVPDGILSYLPFETLIKKLPETVGRTGYKNLEYLLNDYTISYTFSSSYMQQTSKLAKVNSVKKLLAFAPEYRDDYKDYVTKSKPRSKSVLRKDLYPIPGAIEEVNMISDLLPTDKYISGQATERNFIEVAADYDILHLSMHTLLDDVNPMYSKLVFTLGADSSTDGMLNTFEIFDLDLKAQLVVLSACSTGDGILNKGEGVMSMARGFAYAGTPSMLMTLWEVEDASGAMLMYYFYKGLLMGKAKDVALRDAKLEFIENVRPENAHPFFWSTYVLQGNYEALFIKRPLIYFGMGLFVIVLAVLVYYRKKKVLIIR